MTTPSDSAIIYRVSYTRSTRKSGGWTYKLFNSEDAARRYIENLLKPVTDETPEKYRNLPKPTVELAMGIACWQPVGPSQKVQAEYDRKLAALAPAKVAPKAFDCREDD